MGFIKKQTEQVKPVYKDYKGLEIQVAQATNLAIQHLTATKIIEQNAYWEELDKLTTKYFNFLNKKKKELI